MFNIDVAVMSEDSIDDVLLVENLSFTIPWSRQAFLEEIKNNKFAIYFTAAIEGMIVGYAGMWKVYDEGHITNIAVHPEFRKTGVGSELLKHLMQVAREQGITRMTLEVRRSNLAAQRLYSKYGFITEGFRKSYYADNGEDALIMWNYSV